jgi:hypothetical protein
LVEELSDSKEEEEDQWSVVEEVGVTHGTNTDVHEILSVVVEEDFLCVIAVELGAFAYSENGDESDNEGNEDGAGGIEEGHGDEEEFEDVLNGVEDVDELGGGGHV